MSDAAHTGTSPRSLDVDAAARPSVVSMDFDSDEPDRLHSIQRVAHAAGISSRTLRYYDQIGLLPPAATTGSGLRHYDSSSLVRLQRILLLRATGMELKTIAAVLDQEQDEQTALNEHIIALEKQRSVLDRQILTLRNTISTLDKGDIVGLHDSFEGFNEQYEHEVTERWGKEQFTRSNNWWRSLPETGRITFMEESRTLIARWVAAGRQGLTATCPQAQELAEAHIQWLASIPGTPGHRADPAALHGYVRSLAQMYVSDERFAATYEGQAQFVHDALEHFLDHARP